LGFILPYAIALRLDRRSSCATLGRFVRYPPAQCPGATRGSLAASSSNVATTGLFSKGKSDAQGEIVDASGSCKMRGACQMLISIAANPPTPVPPAPPPPGDPPADRPGDPIPPPIPGPGPEPGQPEPGPPIPDQPISALER
jgi:hypothetical protein